MQLFDDSSRHVDRFGLLLGVTIGCVVTLSLVDFDPAKGPTAELGTVVLTAFVSAMLLLALRASGVARRPRRFADVLVGLGFLTTTALAVADLAFDRTVAELGSDARPSVVWVALTALAPLLVLRRVLMHGRVGRATVAGAITGYLLIAVLWDFLYLLVDAIAAPGMFGQPEPTTTSMYFSLVTITTLGYGDISPVGVFGRFLATSEAVIGQVYLVTFVALIVGLYARDRTASRAQSARGD